MAARTTSRAFTLIELLVVMIIIAILIAIVVPALGGARTAARNADTKGLVTNVLNAAQTFMNDEKRMPGYFTAAEMGAAENDDPAVGMSAMENIMLDLMGVEPVTTGGAGIVTVGPSNDPAKQIMVNAELLGSTGQGTKNYFTPDAKHYVAQEPGTQQVGGMGHAAIPTGPQLPDVVDAFGGPLLAWIADENAPKNITSVDQFASVDSGNRAKYYWASNAAFLRATVVGRKGRDQTNTVEGSLIGGAVNSSEMAQRMAAFLGNPSFPYRPASMSGFSDIPAAGRGSIIIQSAGVDNVYFGRRDRGARNFPDAGGGDVNSLDVDYKFSFSADGTNPYLDRDGKVITEDLISDFDDITASGGN